MLKSLFKKIGSYFLNPVTTIYTFMVFVFAVFISVYFVVKDNNQQVNLQKELGEASRLIDGGIISRTGAIASNISKNPAIMNFLKNSSADGRSAGLVLEAAREAAEASIVYLMAPGGTVMASTGFKGGKGTLKGENYRFRPYFTNSIKGVDVIYPAVGVTTMERGIYFSSPVRDTSGGAVLGVIVIKMGLGYLDHILAGVYAPAALVSPDGVVFATNYKEWYLRSIYPMNDAQQEVLMDSKQFAGKKIEFINSRYNFSRPLEYFDGRKNYVSTYPLNLHGWKLVISEPAGKNVPLTSFQRDILVSIFTAAMALIGLVWFMYMNSRAKIALKASEMKYLEIFNTVNDAIFIHDAARLYVVDANKKACDMYGYTRDQLTGKMPGELGDAGEGYGAEKISELMKKARAGEPQIFEWKAVDKSGSRFWVETNLKLGIIGERPVIIAVERDINDRKLADYQLEELVKDLKRSNTELEDFAYVASHDMKEPLRMVSSYVSLLKKRYHGKLDSDADEFIDFATSGAAQMQKLIEDLLAFSRVGTKGGEFVESDTRQIIDRIIANLKFKIADKKAVINAAALPVIRADTMQLEQVFINLISNSLKFAAEGVPLRIEIGAEMKDKTWLFSISDNGIGIDTQYFEKIFVIFQKLHPKEQYEGTGVGLAICRKIVERHGGRIWVESELGRGSTFFFTIPAAL